MSLRKLLLPTLAIAGLFFSADPVNALPRPIMNRLVLTDTLPETDSLELRIFDKVEIEARFPGGDESWIKFLEKNLDPEVPLKHKAPVGRYTVIVQFVVDREGKVSDIKALTNHGYGMEEEVIRLLKKAPKWIPAFQDGRNVKAYRKQPVTFQIDEEKRKRKNKDD